MNKDSKTTERSKLCYACGKPGHYANDPKCERYGKPRLFAIREDDSIEDSEHPNVPPPEDEDEVNDPIPELLEMDNSDKESSDGEYADLDDYDEPYMGRLEEDDDFFGAISLTKPFAETDSVMDPMEGAGPAISLEDEFDEGLFPSLNPKNHPYRMDDDILMALDSGHTNEDNSSSLNYRVKKSSRPMKRPNRGDPKDRKPITVLMEIGGHPALTLMDSGCTIEALSPAHVHLTNGKVYQLTDQHSLQLGTVGSRAKFNFGTTMKTSYGGIDEDVYFDIVNIDRYDAIVGTRFMRKHGIQLDFERGQVLIRGQSAPTLSEGEDHAEFTRCSSMRWDAQAEKFRRKDSDKSLE